MTLFRIRWLIPVAFIMSVGLVGVTSVNAWNQTSTATPTLEDLSTRVATLEEQVAALQTVVASNSSDPGVTKSAKTHDIAFSITIFGYDNVLGDTIGDMCWGYGGYDDMEIGLSISILDQSGDVIGNGRIENAELVKESQCKLSTIIRDVPEVEFYQLKIGRRAAPDYSLDDLVAADWTIELEIGR